MTNMGLILAVRSTCKFSEKVVSLLALKQSRFTTFLISIAAISLVMAVFNAQAQTYDLGKPDAADTSVRAWDINNAAKVVGSADGSGSFLWVPDDPKDIDGAEDDGLANGIFTPTVFHGTSDMSINDLGVIVGRIFGGDAWIRAVDGTELSLGFSGAPKDINVHNQVVGLDNITGAFLWTPANGTTIEDIVPPGGDGIADGTVVQLARSDVSDPVWAMGISDTGWINGFMQSSPDPRIAMWHVDDPATIYDVGFPDFADGAESNAINNLNEIAGRVTCIGCSTPSRPAYLWTPDNIVNPEQDSDPVDGFIDGTFINLGVLGGETARPRGMNDLGQVVGDSSDAAGAPRSQPFFWDPSTGIIESLDVLTSNSGFAQDINNVGLAAGWAQDQAASGSPLTALIWEVPVMAAIDVGVAGGGFRTKGRVRCPSQCEQNIVIKLKNYSDRLARIAYNVTSVPGGPDLSDPDCTGVTGFLNPRETISISGCTVTYATAGNFVLTLTIEPKVGAGEGSPVEDVDLSNNTKDRSVKVL